MHAVVIFGIALVLPLALGGRLWWWALSATAAAGAFAVPRGPGAAVLVVPFALTVVAVLVRWVAGAGPWRAWGLAEGGAGLARVYAVVAAAALAQSRAGLMPFGIREPLVELTAVHYTFAGAAAVVLAERALRHGPGPRALGRAAVVLTAAAPPVVAAGFVTRAAVPQVGGAALMTLGVWATATLELRRAFAERRYPAGAGQTVLPVAAGRSVLPVAASRSVLLVVSGLAVWAPMVLALAWAAGQHWAVPALPVAAMVRTHGAANALGFVLCGLVATR